MTLCVFTHKYFTLKILFFQVEKFYAVNAFFSKIVLMFKSEQLVFTNLSSEHILLALVE